MPCLATFIEPRRIKTLSQGVQSMWSEILLVFSNKVFMVLTNPCKTSYVGRTGAELPSCEQ